MRTLLPAFVLLAALVPAARGSAIIFSSTVDGSGSACVAPPASFPSISTLYVGVYTSGLPGDGFTGAEFLVQGIAELGSNYLVQATLNPAANVSLGNPISGGVNVAFPDCQTGYFVWLYSFQIVNFGDTEMHQLQVVARQPPTNSSLQCPVVVLCDAPVYTAMCLPGATASLNIPREPPAPTNPDPADGATEVPLQVTLRWYVPPIQAEVCEPGTIWQDIFFGTAPNPPYVNSSDGNRQYVVPGTLAPNTRYSWRITAGPNSSPVWSFTTGDVAVSVQRATWTAVRGLYR